MNYENFVGEGKITVYAPVAAFSKEAVLKCLYWYGAKFQASIRFIDGEAFELQLNPLPDAGISQKELFSYVQRLERDLIDFELRAIIAKETANIRDLLVAKAFSNGEYDEEPPGEISDPVGFHPNLIT